MTRFAKFDVPLLFALLLALPVAALGGGDDGDEQANHQGDPHNHQKDDNDDADLRARCAGAAANRRQQQEQHQQQQPAVDRRVAQQPPRNNPNVVGTTTATTQEGDDDDDDALTNIGDATRMTTTNTVIPPSSSATSSLLERFVNGFASHVPHPEYSALNTPIAAVAATTITLGCVALGYNFKLQLFRESSDLISGAVRSTVDFVKRHRYFCGWSTFCLFRGWLNYFERREAAQCYAVDCIGTRPQSEGRRIAQRRYDDRRAAEWRAFCRDVAIAGAFCGGLSFLDGFLRLRGFGDFCAHLKKSMSEQDRQLMAQKIKDCAASTPRIQFFDQCPFDVNVTAVTEYADPEWSGVGRFFSNIVGGIFLSGPKTFHVKAGCAELIALNWNDNKLGLQHTMRITIALPGVAEAVTRTVAPSNTEVLDLTYWFSQETLFAYAKHLGVANLNDIAPQ